MRVDKSKWKQNIMSDCIKTIKVKDSVQKKDYQQYGKYPIISQEKDLISGYCDSIENLNSTGNVLIFGDHTRVLKFVDFDFCVGADGVKVIQPNSDISTKYLFYFLKWADIPSNGYSRHFKFLKELNISYPPLSNQQAIASELDAIQTMIDGYKTQLEDLDTLVQSIFLDIFGDPVNNDKDWIIKKFADLFALKSGDGLSAKHMIQGLYPVYGGNGINGHHNTYNKDGEYILIGRVGAYCGNVRLVNGKFWLTDNAFEVITKSSSFSNVFLATLLRIINLGKKAKKTAQPVISNVSLKDVLVPIPPLALQQQFAHRIEAIERQKELIRFQLKDAKNLMAERMQYYFS